MEAKTQRIRMALVAAIAAGLLFILFPKLSTALRGRSSESEDDVTVLVADRYLPAFTVIKPELVRGEEYPRNLVPPGALRDKAELQNDHGQLLFTSAVALPEGQPVTRAFVTDAAQSDALGSLIRPGKVAVSFEVDKAHGVGGWIRPGDTIALFGAAAPAASVRLLLPSVMVLAIDGQRLGQGDPKVVHEDRPELADLSAVSDSKVVTVLVCPSDASTIIEAREKGNLSVVLRSLGDDVVWNAVH